MQKNIFKIIQILFISFPLLLVVAAISFLFGIFVSSPDDAKYMTLLVGAFAGVLAFIGVAYSKECERKLKEDELIKTKLEDFVANLFVYLGTSLELSKQIRLIYEKTIDKNFSNVQEVNEEYDSLTSSFANYYSIVAKHNMFVSLYGNSIGNEELLHDLDIVHGEILNSLNLMIGENEIEEFQRRLELYSVFYNKAAGISMKISAGININTL